MIVVVLGMHRSGTSMASHMLIKLGVHMGDELLRGQRGNPDGHFEDLDFLRLDKRILAAAGGDWRDVPADKAIEAAFDDRCDRVWELLHKKIDQDRDWGWKDPRSALLIPYYHRELERLGARDIRYVWTMRRGNEIAASLIRRNGGRKREWKRLATRYHQAIRRFLDTVRSPVFLLRYEQVTNKKHGSRIAVDLARFCGRNERAATRALEVVRFR